MKKNLFIRVLSIGLTFCVSFTNIPYSTNLNISNVKAAELNVITENEDIESETSTENDLDETQIELVTEAESVENIETETTQPVETEVSDNTESVTEEIQTIEDESSEIETETIQTESVEIETVDIETETTTETISEEETSTINDEEKFLLDKLKEVQEIYPQMYINENGLFEMVGDSGEVYTYDPYDPEFDKYMLGYGIMDEEYDDDTLTTLSEGEFSTVSPFTGKTYTHEAHVAGKKIRHGVDISKYQLNVNWDKAKAAGVEFAIIRIGGRGYGAAGNLFGDEYALNNIINAYNKGVKVGLYFFSQAITEAEAIEEAKYCINYINNNNISQYISLPIFIDYEYSPTGTSGRLYNAHLSKSQHQAICDAFVKYIESYGYEGGIYANFSMLRDDMQPTKSNIYKNTTYWIARYNTATHYSNNYDFWQYSSSGSIPGITDQKYVSSVDCNFWYSEPKDINDSTCQVMINEEFDYVSDLDDIKDSVTIYDTERNYILKEYKDYNILVTSTESTTQSNVINLGIGIVGIGNYQGKITKAAKMKQMQLLDTMVGILPQQTYTGKGITTSTGLELNINHAGVTLVEGTDYTVIYENNVNVGTATAYITGKGMYTGQIQCTFKIVPKLLSLDMVSDIPDVYYTGQKLTTDTGVCINLINNESDTKLTQSTDYTLKYASNINVGVAKVTITGKGNYKGSVATSFNILKTNIGNDSFELNDNVKISIGGTTDTYITQYTGKNIRPKVVVTVDGRVLKSTDYTLQYANNKEVSTEAYVIITGKKNYEGVAKKFFSIEPKPEKPTKLTSKMVSLESTVIRATGKNIIPNLHVTSGNNLLVENTDYKVTYFNNKKVQITSITQVGTYTITVEGINKYTGKVSVKLKVIDSDKKLIGSDYSKVTLILGNEYTYTGKAIKPEIEVLDKTLSNITLTNGKDYTISYSDNTKAGIAKYTIKGKGKYTGTYTSTFTINPKNLGILSQTQNGVPIESGDVKVSLNKYDFNYNGKTQQPKVTIKDAKKVLKQNTDYTINYVSANKKENYNVRKNADTYTINISFIGNYSGSASIKYKINPIELNKLKASVPKQYYTGYQICPDMSDMTFKIGNVKLYESDLSGVVIDGWTNNILVSTGKSKAGFTLVSAGENTNFKKSSAANVSFIIAKLNITDSNLNITVGNMPVNKNISELELVYSDVYYDATNGANIVITDITTGKTLIENTDYTVKYSNNKNVGKAKIKITGIGGYSSSRTITFTILGKPIGNGTENEGYKLELEELTEAKSIYTGKAISPQVKLYEGTTVLKKNTDYTVKYQNNVNAGTATVVVTGKGKYAGTIKSSYTIKPKTLSYCKKVLVSSISKQKYTGKVIIPSFTVKIDGKTLKKGTDYTVSVLNSTKLTYTDKNIQKGVATVIITGIGNYKGVLAKKNFIVYK